MLTTRMLNVLTNLCIVDAPYCTVLYCTVLYCCRVLLFLPRLVRELAELTQRICSMLKFANGARNLVLFLIFVPERYQAMHMPMHMPMTY